MERRKKETIYRGIAWNESDHSKLTHFTRGLIWCVCVHQSGYFSTEALCTDPIIPPVPHMKKRERERQRERYIGVCGGGGGGGGWQICYVFELSGYIYTNNFIAVLTSEWIAIWPDDGYNTQLTMPIAWMCNEYCLRPSYPTFCQLATMSSYWSVYLNGGPYCIRFCMAWPHILQLLFMLALALLPCRGFLLIHCCSVCLSVCLCLSKCVFCYLSLSHSHSLILIINNNKFALSPISNCSLCFVYFALTLPPCTHIVLGVAPIKCA